MKKTSGLSLNAEEGPKFPLLPLFSERSLTPRLRDSGSRSPRTEIPSPLTARRSGPNGNQEKERRTSFGSSSGEEEASSTRERKNRTKDLGRYTKHSPKVAEFKERTPSRGTELFEKEYREKKKREKREKKETKKQAGERERKHSHAGTTERPTHTREGRTRSRSAKSKRANSISPPMSPKALSAEQKRRRRKSVAATHSELSRKVKHAAANNSNDASPQASGEVSLQQAKTVGYALCTSSLISNNTIQFCSDVGGVFRFPIFIEYRAS